MKTKTTRVPATTNNITKGIVNFLNSKGHCAFRVNTAGIYDRGTGQFRRMASSSLGCPDVIACMRYQIDPATRVHGHFYGFEIKNESTKDRIRKDQQDFAGRVDKAGGHILIIRSYPEFLRWYDQSSFNK